MNLLFWIALQYGVAVTPPVVVPPPATDTGFIGGSGGGGFSRGGSVTSGTTVSRQRWKAWERAITQSMRAPTEKRVSAKRQQPTKATVEAAIRRLNLPEAQKERILQEWKSKVALPSLEVVAIAYGLSTRADVWTMNVDTGNEAQVQPIVTFTAYGRMGVEAVKNPSDEELIQLLLLS